MEKKEAAEWVLKNSLTAEQAWLMLIACPREGMSNTAPGATKEVILDRELKNIEQRITVNGEQFNLCTGNFPDRVLAQMIIMECK